MSLAEQVMATVLRDAGHEFEREYKFHPKRKWRFDFVVVPVSEKIAIEVEGGIWSQGRHVRGNGFMKDVEKYNAAATMGWCVLRYAPTQIPRVVKDIKDARLTKREKKQRRKVGQRNKGDAKSS